jgi:hypothetical protein
MCLLPSKFKHKHETMGKGFLKYKDGRQFEEEPSPIWRL